MVSEIKARVSENTTLNDLLASLFPCGSITGAPKVSTMKIIEEIEKGDRGVYCGAIAYLSPSENILSVPIRILQKPKNAEAFRYRVGGGIVWDYDARQEWNETRVKSKLLKTHYRLVETLLVENGKMTFSQQHWKRMKKSAKQWGFSWNKEIE